MTNPPEIIIIGNEDFIDRLADIVLVTPINDDQFRFVLRWGPIPGDFDFYPYIRERPAYFDLTSFIAGQRCEFQALCPSPDGVLTSAHHGSIKVGYGPEVVTVSGVSESEVVRIMVRDYASAYYRLPMDVPDTMVMGRPSVAVYYKGTSELHVLPLGPTTSWWEVVTILNGVVTVVNAYSNPPTG